ncbi:MAG: DUF4157 domain-containing protein [Flavobacteriaceae bacterium]|nr:DUF4157 domain-containing protein [Flavobacteriaceae bacterium]
MSSRSAESNIKKKSHTESDMTPVSENIGVSKFTDNRPEAIAQRKLQAMANASPKVNQTVKSQAMANDFTSTTPIQKKRNTTGLPDQHKLGIENLSGYAMDDVKVHRNSNKPAQLNAHAYAQGTDIHLATGQEKHLPHEAWHVVQQKQGRVKPTLQMKVKVNINDDEGLEKEADMMGAKAAQNSEEKTSKKPLQKKELKSLSNPSQLKQKTDLTPGGLNMIGETHKDYKDKNARAYDAHKIKEKLGEGVQYYLEGSLKTKKSNKDFSDPVDLRLEQIISFTQEYCSALLPKLLKIDTGKLTLEASQIAENKGSVSGLVEQLTPKIMSEIFNVEEVLQIIIEKNLSGDQLVALSETEIWKRETVDPEDKYEDNFEALEYKLLYYGMRKQSQEEQLAIKPVEPDEIPKA